MAKISEQNLRVISSTPTLEDTAKSAEKRFEYENYRNDYLKGTNGLGAQNAVSAFNELRTLIANSIPRIQASAPALKIHVVSNDHNSKAISLSSAGNDLHIVWKVQSTNCLQGAVLNVELWTNLPVSGFPLSAQDTKPAKTKTFSADVTEGHEAGWTHAGPDYLTDQHILSNIEAADYILNWWLENIVIKK